MQTCFPSAINLTQFHICMGKVLFVNELIDMLFCLFASPFCLRQMAISHLDCHTSYLVYCFLDKWLSVICIATLCILCCLCLNNRFIVVMCILSYRRYPTHLNFLFNQFACEID